MERTLEETKARYLELQSHPKVLNPNPKSKNFLNPFMDIPSAVRDNGISHHPFGQSKW